MIETLLHRKNGFADVSKNLAEYGYLKIILLKSNYVERLNVDGDAVKNFNILAI